jgi:recyclin-1
MSKFTKTPLTGGKPPPPKAPRKDVLASLKMAQIVASKPLLPAEILSTVLEYLAVPDLIRFARASKRMQEMVYEDSRWVQRLKRMGVWDEGEAQKRGRERAEGNVNGGVEEGVLNGVQRRPTIPVDPGGEGRGGGVKGNAVGERRKTIALEDGFDAIGISAVGEGRVISSKGALSVLKHVRSMRGHARQEYGKVYAVLGPYYDDIVRLDSDGSDPLVFQKFDRPEDQAQMLSQLKTFSKSDIALGWSAREMRLDDVVSSFENAALREFRQGYENMDIDGQMRQYAHVLGVLNDGQAGIELFIHHNHLVTQKERYGSPVACIDPQGGIDLNRTAGFFDRLSMGWIEEVAIIDQAFPPSAKVISPFVEKIGTDIISPFLSILFDEIHERSVESYLKAVAGTFAQSLQFGRELRPSSTSGDEFYDAVERVICKIFEPHIDLYLAEELDFFRKKSEAEVDNWDRALSEQAASTESFLMSNVNRVQDKRDFLTSFKKVVMMPVNILPSFSSKPTATKPLVNGESLETGHHSTLSQSDTSRPSTPVPLNMNRSMQQIQTPDRSSTPIPNGTATEAPTTELAAKAAIMNSKLEGIRSLFSIEVALNTVHSAKSSLERCAQFTKLAPPAGPHARAQCERIFILLLQTLGYRHIQTGFDSAVSHLSDYNPRSHHENQDPETNSSPAVEPLVTFLELVNVGDLIQQMLELFYETELVATKITDRSDFLNPAVKEKKKFEQMLDGSVAAGLNKGIDVLIDNVDYILSTTQLPSDYNPPSDVMNEVGPTETSTLVIASVSSHTHMLTGSTDKAMLDVFNSEVGLRLFSSLTKHLKRHRISVAGSIRLIADMNAYYAYIETLKNADLLQYFMALRELSQIYLIDGGDAAEMAEVVADGERWGGVWRAEEVLEFAQRRADWYVVRRGVERAMYGIGCGIM